ncbi:MAG: HAMP domain-containing histidine kinase [Campylobacterales bacterium]|nr:HAMP domain-containing histidine kinase [Campylobacterales bacterium]
MNCRLKLKMQLKKTKNKMILSIEQSKSITISKLLINLAHQWRQPLNVISLSAQNIVDTLRYEDWKIEDIEEVSEKIVDNSKELSNTITKLTEFHNNTNQKQKFSIIQGIEEAKTFLSNPKIVVKTNIDSDKTFVGEKKSFIEVFINILQNSIDASLRENKENLEVTIFVDITSDFTTFKVSDNCGGVDKSIINKIFEPYATIDFKSNHKGLGLYLTKSIVENRLNGYIKVENSNDGALFTINLING